MKDYRLTQEFMTPYISEQNVIVERSFLSLREECTWQHLFEDFEYARRVIRYWIRLYNEERLHQSLEYLSPTQYRPRQLQLVA